MQVLKSSSSLGPLISLIKGRALRFKSSKLDKTLPGCVKHVPVQFCGPLYEDFHRLGLSHYEDYDLESNGIKCNARILDNQSLIGDDAKQTVLMIHGARGSASCFSELIEHLTTKGVRVIAPDFPDLSLSLRDKFYRHSPLEKSEFLKQIVSSLNITSVDCLASHSTGLADSIQLMKRSTLAVKSLVWLNPVCFERLEPLRPFWTIKVKSSISNRQVERRNKIERTVLKVLRQLGGTFITRSFESLIQQAMTLRFTNCDQLEAGVLAISKAKIPLLLLVADDDKQMSRSANYRLISKLGLNDQLVEIYDEKGSLESLGIKSEHQRVIRTRSGGHSSFKTNHRVINEAVYEHLKSLKSEVGSCHVPSDNNDKEKLKR